MNETTYRKLELDRILEKLTGMCISSAGKKLAERHRPSALRGQAEAWLQETYEAACLLESGASVPLSPMEGIDSFLALIGKGRIYTESELEQLAVWLVSVSQMKKYMASKSNIAPTISTYAESMDDCPVLRAELNRCIRFGQLTDQASAELAHIRRHMYATEEKISRKLEQALSKYRASLQEYVVSKRKDRFVIAVKRELRKQVPGTVLDESASGQTLFVEPHDVAELQAELQQWKAAEEQERTVILALLSEAAEGFANELKQNLDAMAALDFILARAKLSLSFGGKRVQLTDEPMIRLIGARHPLLGADSVPLTVELGIGWKQLIITGPNTGGKTVTLKTIGLLTLMAQSGLLIPAEQGSVVGALEHVIADVGDGQSLEQSLSTFSSHIRVLTEMLTHAGPRALLLLDEMAAGTDPSEGIALSIALLEKLLERGALVVATTHFNEIKTFASHMPGCQNGRMAFDPLSLKPLYVLEMGEAGDSHAFAIARRYGLSEEVLQRAERLLIRKRQPEMEAGVEIQPWLQPAAVHAKRPVERARGGEERPRKLVKALEQGDAVWIYPLKRLGIVFRPADERGNVIVQVQKQKLTFNQKRLKLHIEREELYPGEDYDLDIVFETKQNRKNRKLMSRKHVEGLMIETPDPDKLP